MTARRDLRRGRVRCEVRDVDVDPIAVERRIAGDLSVTLTRDEVAEVWRVMTARGDSAQRIAHVLEVTPRTVVRWRSGRVATPQRTQDRRRPVDRQELDDLVEEERREHDGDCCDPLDLEAVAS